MFLSINGQRHTVPDGWQDDTLLMVLREALGLVGPKLGCGQGQCGACTVLVDGQPQRSCLLPVSAVLQRPITTLEGLAGPDGRLHPVQQAWLDEAVPQCGYCQAGQIMATVALLDATPQPTRQQVEAALAPQLCRCGTQPRIRRAVQRAVQLRQQAAR
ncbi:(2Fe-2S)-binding protein [Ideonella sp. 4Y16]|uniref:(2Fe-2S)-binding protein n=1 Tax=Ideonella alba TaxID=2824118 RepID=UPI001B36F8C2|nr:(2Fe-2S)-binding protein [Ideonella alba]MBQ0942913.1 (2Fe-2S)-binding protein [Ideonella alba]